MTDEAPPVKPSKGGRPRAPDPGVPVATWLPSSDYDRLLKTATKHETTVSALVRTWLRLKLK
jgi:hypothetical protein